MRQRPGDSGPRAQVAARRGPGREPDPQPAVHWAVATRGIRGSLLAAIEVPPQASQGPLTASAGAALGCPTEFDRGIPWRHPGLSVATHRAVMLLTPLSRYTETVAEFSKSRYRTL